MAEANPVCSPRTSEITADNNDDITILDQLLPGGETGEDLALLENLSDESGTGAIVDSEMLDAVVREMCGNPEEPQQEKKYAYLTNPPVAKKGPISSFCSFVGGKFNKEPEQMVSSETGDDTNTLLMLVIHYSY